MDPPQRRLAPGLVGLIPVIRHSVKLAGLTVGMLVVALPVVTARLEALLTDREEFFVFWSQTLALVPGLPGKYLRKCYYKLTLRAFPLSSEVGFLSHFTHRNAEVGERVYVGSETHLGTITIGEGAQIGSRVSVLSGKNQHQFGPDGRLTPCGPESLQPVRIGEETWIGEGALIMADVGNRCIVAAGSVISLPIPDGCLVGGNPARYVRRVWPPASTDSTPPPGP